MRPRVDDVFAPAGLAVFLTAAISYDAVDDDPTVAAHLPGVDRPIYLSRADFRCASCDGAVDPPQSRPGFWLAYNRAVNGNTVCTPCMADEDGIAYPW